MAQLGGIIMIDPKNAAQQVRERLRCVLRCALPPERAGSRRRCVVVPHTTGSSMLHTSHAHSSTQCS